MNDLLPMVMRLAAVLQIARLKEKGGPDDADMRKARETSDMLGERGDVLLCGGGKPGECADLFNRTAHAIAVLAFCPGGVEVFGARFEAKAVPMGKGKNGRRAVTVEERRRKL